MADFPAFCLGPMAGFTDAAMRSVCIAMGAPIAYTEMVSARGLTEGNRNTKTLLSHFANERRLIAQIFGHDPQTMAEACRLLEEELEGALFGVDINMGCPVAKVSRNGEGSALMGDPLLAGRIIESCAKASRAPVSVKIRAGLRADSVNAAQIARIAEESGAARVAVHGRTASMLYRGTSDRGVIAEVKNAVGIPVIANGDVNSARDALLLLEETGCDSVMVARGAVGNPFIFREIAAALAGRPLPAPASESERIETLLTQARLAVIDKGEYAAIREMRAHIPKYLKGMRGASAMRSVCNAVTTYEALEETLKSYLERLKTAR